MTDTVALAEHEHAWTTDPGVVAHYVCSCGATGYRHWRTGDIRPHRHRRFSGGEEITARAITPTNQFGHGRTTPKPGAP